MVHDYIKLAGVQANSAKRIMTLSSNESKYDPITSSNTTELLQTNRIEPVALMFEATLDCYQQGLKSGKNEQKHLQSLEDAVKDISYNVIKSTSKMKVKSMAQEYHSASCDVDMDPYKANKVVRDRFDLLKQQLQHQINDKCQSDSTRTCSRHNLSPPCKINQYDQINTWALI